MTLKLGFTDEFCNTQYAPLAVLFAHYQQNQRLQPLASVQIMRFFVPRQVRASGGEYFEWVQDLFRHQYQAKARVGLGPGMRLGTVCRSIQFIPEYGCANSNEHCPITGSHPGNLVSTEPTLPP